MIAASQAFLFLAFWASQSCWNYHQTANLNKLTIASWNVTKFNAEFAIHVIWRANRWSSLHLVLSDEVHQMNFAVTTLQSVVIYCCMNTLVLNCNGLSDITSNFVWPIWHGYLETESHEDTIWDTGIDRRNLRLIRYSFMISFTSIIWN